MRLIDEMVNLADIISYALRDWDDYMDELRETETLPIDSFEEFIADAILSAGYRNQKWIAVSEQMPKTDGRFMVTIKNRGKYRTEMRNYDHAARKWESARVVPDNIIAWQQRPEPYRPDCGAKMEG